MLADGSKSFHAASLLLPATVRRKATIFYAFCRLADDAVDHASNKKGALEVLKGRLDRLYARDPLDQAVDRIFADLVREQGLPRAVLDALFEGFEWDAQDKRYDSLSDVRAYGLRVAGTVGVAMALLMGCNNPHALARACELGIAMQLTNIARDVGEDANAARLYLPRDWMWEEGLDPDAWMARPEMSKPLGRVIARLLSEADRLYRRSEAGIAVLPAMCRPAIYAARYIYADIGRRIVRNRYDSVNKRAVIGGGRKVALIAQAVASTPLPRTGLTLNPLPECRVLLSQLNAGGDETVANLPHPLERVAGVLYQAGHHARMTSPARR